MAGLAKYLGVPQQNKIDLSKLVNGFAWVDQPKITWDCLKNIVLNKELDELEIIDFPKGQARHRIFTAKDLYKKSWAFWKKSEPLTWQEIISS